MHVTKLLSGELDEVPLAWSRKFAVACRQGVQSFVGHRFIGP